MCKFKNQHQKIIIYCFDISGFLELTKLVIHRKCDQLEVCKRLQQVWKTSMYPCCMIGQVVYDKQRSPSIAEPAWLISHLKI